MKRRNRCPFCGLALVHDDGAQSIAHEEPVCERFHEAAMSVGEPPEVRRVREEALPAHLAALRARVRAKRNQ